MEDEEDEIVRTTKEWDSQGWLVISSLARSLALNQQPVNPGAGSSPAERLGTGSEPVMRSITSGSSGARDLRLPPLQEIADCPLPQVAPSGCTYIRSCGPTHPRA